MKTYLLLLLFFVNFLSKAQTATVYFLNPDFPLCTSMKLHLLIDADRAISAKKGRFDKIELQPGQYIVQGSAGGLAKPSKPQKFVFLANESYYFLYIPDDLLELSRATGINLLAKCSPSD